MRKNSMAKRSAAAVLALCMAILPMQPAFGAGSSHGKDNYGVSEDNGTLKVRLSGRQLWNGAERALNSGRKPEVDLKAEYAVRYGLDSEEYAQMFGEEDIYEIELPGAITDQISDTGLDLRAFVRRAHDEDSAQENGFNQEVKEASGEFIVLSRTENLSLKVASAGNLARASQEAGGDMNSVYTELKEELLENAAGRKSSDYYALTGDEPVYFLLVNNKYEDETFNVKVGGYTVVKNLKVNNGEKYISAIQKISKSTAKAEEAKTNRANVKKASPSNLAKAGAAKKASPSNLAKDILTSLEKKIFGKTAEADGTWIDMDSEEQQIPVIARLYRMPLKEAFDSFEAEIENETGNENGNGTVKVFTTKKAIPTGGTFEAAVIGEEDGKKAIVKEALAARSITPDGAVLIDMKFRDTLGRTFVPKDGEVVNITLSAGISETAEESSLAVYRLEEKKGEVKNIYTAAAAEGFSGSIYQEISEPDFDPNNDEEDEEEFVMDEEAGTGLARMAEDGKAEAYFGTSGMGPVAVTWMESDGNGREEEVQPGTENGTIPAEAAPRSFLAKGSDWEVEIHTDGHEGFPENTELQVTELLPGDEGYDAYLAAAGARVKEEEGEVVLKETRFFDISFVSPDFEGQKLEPKTAVDVTIRASLGQDSSQDNLRVLHFAEDAKKVEIEVPDIEAEAEIASKKLSAPMASIMGKKAGKMFKASPKRTVTVESPEFMEAEFTRKGKKGEMRFQSDRFSVYAVTTYKATAELDGKSFAIVQVNTQSTQDIAVGNNTVYAGRAMTAAAQSSNTRLAGMTVNVETHESGLNMVSSGSEKVTEWTFTAAGGANAYTITSPDGRYLNVKKNALVLSDTPQTLYVLAGTGNQEGKVRITDGTTGVQSSARANSRSASSSQYFNTGTSSDADYIYLTLCGIREIDPEQFPVYSGEKLRAQDLVDGQKYIIYKNIYNTVTDQYEDWIIDGNGNPKRAYDQGDSLSLHSEISPMWVLHICEDGTGKPTGYYIFRNEETGLCLCPQADGTLVAEYESNTTSGIALSGREGGKYTSTLEKWDESAMHWYGYQLATDGAVTLNAVTGSASQDFSFAEEKVSEEGLHTVSTVDSAANGINIHMFNYPNRSTIAGVTGSDGYGVGIIPTQHVRSTLVNGYPVFTNGKNGSALFSTGNKSYYQGTGNRLFLESVYDSTGYYEYSAFNNFAHYNKGTGEFTVYQETGTPSPTSNNFYFKRGNFLPYNSLNTNNRAQNIYTGSGTLIDYENPNYGSTLYGLSGTTDFYFGMTMDFHFLMPKNGYEKGSPLIYEFNGDDDLWIFIDNVLILDIGGVHDAFPGSINFATGEITGGNGGAGKAKTIRECFENAGLFPDGTPWDDTRADAYFNGDTFVNYGSHQFNMFYMEHGAGASNLQMRFNLPVIEKGKVTVEKQLDNTSQAAYANVLFAFQMFKRVSGTGGEAVTGTDIPLTEAVYEGKTDPDQNPIPVAFYDGVEIEGKTYDHVFYLKPGEAAVFSDFVPEEEYYVQEIGVRSDYYDQILVNDVKIDGETAEAREGVYRSSVSTVQNRAKVTYTNHCDERNVNELRITKRIAEDSYDNGDTFEFRVLLENAAGELSAYYQGTYYIRDDEGVYYRYVDGKLVANGMTPYAMTAGNYGTIARIPAGYTVVIQDLLAGTDFYVDEIRVRPDGGTSDVLLAESEWILDSVVTGECDDADITSASIYDYATDGYIEAAAMGKIAHGKDAQITFTNRMKNPPGPVLPNTGGPGTWPFRLWGIILMLAAAMLKGVRHQMVKR